MIPTQGAAEEDRNVTLFHHKYCERKQIFTAVEHRYNSYWDQHRYEYCLASFWIQPFLYRH